MDVRTTERFMPPAGRGRGGIKISIFPVRKTHSEWLTFQDLYTLI